MGRIHVPKPPKKRKNWISKSTLIARAVLDSLSTSKESTPVASRRIPSVCFPLLFRDHFRFLRRSRCSPISSLTCNTFAVNATPVGDPALTVFKMGPRGTRDSTETKNVHPAGKGKEKAKISRASSNASLEDLTPEVLDTGIAAVRQITKIFRFAQVFHEEIGDVEAIHGLGVRQQARIDELETTVTNLAFGKKQEMAKLQNENEAYQANVRQISLDKEELERQRASMNDTRTAMQLKIEKQKEMEINRAKHEFSIQSNAKVKQIKEELENKIQALEDERDGFKSTTKKLEEKNIQAKKDLKKQKESFELDKRTCQSHIMRLESELNNINTASTVLPQTPEF